MQIGELSERTSVSERSLRHYEQKGLLQSKRLENGYRDFAVSQIDRVNAVQFYLSLGLNTDQIERILNCQGHEEVLHEEQFCEGLLLLYEQKLAGIKADIANLSEVESRLEERVVRLKALKGI